MLDIYFLADLSNLIGRLHDDYRNIYTLEKDGQKFTLAPLTPQQVYEDELRT